MATADGPAGHHRDYRLRNAANLHLQIQHIQTRHLVFAYVATMPANTLVATGAEGFAAFARQDDDADVGIVAAMVPVSYKHFTLPPKIEGCTYGGGG